MIFGNTNAIEPTDIERKRAKEAPPIREATGAEVAGAALRRAREDAAPVKAVKSSPAREPDPIAERHGLYTAERLGSRRYYADYQQKSEVMRASSARISSQLDDKATVFAMIGLAESRGWQSVKLSGSESFRREAWVQASMRGIATEGYKAQETDKQELARRQNAMERPAATVKAEAPTSAKAIPITASKPAAAEAQQPQEVTTQSVAAKAAPKAGRREIANGWTEGEAEAMNRRISKREGERTIAAEPSNASMRKAERAADPTDSMHDAARERRADAHRAEAGVWNTVEVKGAEAIAHRASLKEKADAARSAQEQRALAAQAARATSTEKAA